MADTYYAWTRILHGAERDDQQNITKQLFLNPGDTVTRDQIGDDEASWREKVEGGAVRTMPYPDMPPEFQGSPIEFLRQKASEAENLAVTGLSGSYFGPSEETLLTQGVDLKAETASGAPAVVTSDKDVKK